MSEKQKVVKNRRKTAVKVLKTVGLVFACVLVAGLLINSLLGVFVRGYYPTFGKYRLFAIVSNSMEGEIAEGNMIVCSVPQSPDEIEIGTVVTYELKRGDSITLITHRVVDVHFDGASGEYSYTTRGDNTDGEDTYRPKYSDVVGIFTGGQCGFLGYFFGFLRSGEGAIALILIAAVAVIAIITVHFINLVNVWRKVAVDALKKSGALLSESDKSEYGTIADVIGIAVKEPRDKADARRKDKKLKWYLKTGKLPQRPYDDDLDEDALKAEVGETTEPAPEKEKSDARDTETSEKNDL